MTRRIPRIALACLIVLCAGRAGAVPIVWELTGVVKTFQGSSDPIGTTVAPEPLAAEGIVNGAPVTGRIVFRSNAQDSDPSPDRGQYGPLFREVQLTFGNLDMEFTTGITDFGVASVRPTRGYFGGLFNLTDADGFEVFFGFIELVDSDLSELSTEALPLAPDLAGLDLFDLTGFPDFNTSVGLGVLFEGGSSLVRAEITSLASSFGTDPVTTPEPGTFSLVALGLVFLGIARRRGPR